MCQLTLLQWQQSKHLTCSLHQITDLTSGNLTTADGRSDPSHSMSPPIQGNWGMPLGPIQVISFENLTSVTLAGTPFSFNALITGEAVSQLDTLNITTLDIQVYLLDSSNQTGNFQISISDPESF